MTLIKNKNALDKLCISRDGSTVFCTSGNGILRIQDAAAGAKVSVLSTATGGGLTLSPDDQLLAGEDNMGVIKLWDAKTGHAIRTLLGHTANVGALAFLANGEALASTSDFGDGTIRLWNIADGREIRMVPTPNMESFALAATPDGAIVVPQNDGPIKVWDFPAVRWAHQHQAAIAGAFATLARRPNDGPALAVLGEWYAFRRMNDWAATLLERARAQGATISALTLARCYWQLNQPEKAAGEFEKAMKAHEAPDFYLALCRDAVLNESHIAPGSPGGAPAIPTVPEATQTPGIPENAQAIGPKPATTAK